MWLPALGSLGFPGDNGPAVVAQLHFPCDVALDRTGNLFISDALNRRVRKVTPAGVITTIAGSGRKGMEGDGGPATEATFYEIDSLTVNAAGSIYIHDWFSHSVRAITGSATGIQVIEHVASILGASMGIRFDSAGNLFIANQWDHSVRKLAPSRTYENSLIAIQLTNAPARP